MKLRKNEDVRFVSNTSHIDNTVKSWTMTPEELVAYNSKSKSKSKVEVDKMNGLTKEKYQELKAAGNTDVVICRKYRINAPQLVDWKKDTFTKEELRALNLPKRVQKENVTKTIQEEIKPQETESEKLQTHEKESNSKLAIHTTDFNYLIEEKELAYQKADEVYKQYLDTLEALKKTDVDLENTKQKLREMESERDQYKLSFEKSQSISQSYA